MRPLIEVDKSKQHKQRATEGVNKEFKNGAVAKLFVRVFAPKQGDEINRYQSEFPKDIEQKPIGCQEYSQQSKLHQQDKRIKRFCVVNWLAVSSEDDKRHQESGKRHQHKT